MKKLSPTAKKKLEFREESKRNTQRRRYFCNELVRQLGFRAVKDKRRNKVYWLDSRGSLNNVLVRYILWPDSYYDSIPWIVRLFVNHYSADIPRTSLGELLGYKARPRYDHCDPPENRGWSFELSLLPTQLEDTIPWFVHLAHSKDQRVFDESVVPPYECRWWFGYRPECNYAWSTDAHKAYEAWNAPRLKARERMLERIAERKRKAEANKQAEETSGMECENAK